MDAQFGYFLIDNIDDMVLVLEHDSITHANKSFQRELYFTKEELIGQKSPFSFLSGVDSQVSFITQLQCNDHDTRKYQVFRKQFDPVSMTIEVKRYNPSTVMCIFRMDYDVKQKLSKLHYYEVKLIKDRFILLIFIIL